MPNPFDFVHEIRAMNELLVSKLDTMIGQLDIVIELLDAHNKIDSGMIEVDQEITEEVASQLRDMWYGDGK